MSFDPYKIDLPVTEIIDSVKRQLTDGNTLIVSAPPGAGKSTLLPLALMEEDWLAGKKMMMLEPRRLAARAIASRMASLLGEEVGQSVGYRIRFENRTSGRTKIEVVTEGILTRMLQSDNSLEGVGLVIFDEFHERSIHADVALALCREAQQILRPDLRIMVMSATLDMQHLPELLKASVAESQGKQFPVELIYTGDQDITLLPDMAARTILKASREREGDILAFFPGEGEIRKCEEILKKELRGFAVHPLYGQLPQSQQLSAMFPDKQGRRKVVLATSIAETSLTIEGVRVVVDTGFGRTSRFDPRSGLSRLETVQVSKDSADQRAGRAGRLASGTCYRMWTKATQQQLADHRTPEILEADLAGLVLDMAQWGIVDVQQLTWLTPPPKGALAQASDVLHQIEALNNRKITEHGRKIHQLPCHPRIAHMLLLAEDNGNLALAADLAAVLEEKDPLSREAGIDVTLRIEALRRFRNNGGEGRLFGRIAKVAEAYRRLFDAEEDNSAFDPYKAGVLVAYVYPERIAYARPGNNAQFQLANGRFAMAGHKDDLAHQPWLAVANLDAREGTGKIFLAAPLNPKDLAPMVKEREVVTWDTRRGGLIATRDLRIGSIVLQSKPLPAPDEKFLVKAICDVIKKEGETLLNFDDHVKEWQNRVLSLRRWNPGEGWPDVTTPALLASCEDWLSPYLQHVKKPDDLKRLALPDILRATMDWERQQQLDRLAPAAIEVPTGSKIKLQYNSNGEPPVLAVRLQEVFGMAETPLVNNGKNSVVLHLLSPGYKPVQVTSDLKSFWNNAYFEVKKDLKRRYPKHSWPDDPWTAEAVRGVKRKP